MNSSERPRPIYLDYHATTPVDSRVLEAMLPYFTDKFGNAASRQHLYGQQSALVVEEARTEVARLLGARPKEIIFTSGATESNNLALKGVLTAYSPLRRHLITAQTEHRSILDPARSLEKQGFSVTYLPVDAEGRVTAVQVEEALTPETALVSLMAANNEIGTLHPLREIGEVCKRRGVLLHTDAAQAVGKVPLSVEELGIDLLSLSGHKMYAPQGIGALYVRSRDPHVRLVPLLEGGGHERGLRSGTVPVPLVVALGKACSLCQAELPSEASRLRQLRDRLQDRIQTRLEGVFLNGHPTERLPNNLHLSFAWVPGSALLTQLSNVAVSSGSACTSAHPEPSHVLRALGVENELLQASLRFGLGRFTTQADIDTASDEVVEVVNGLRKESPLYALHCAEAK